MKYLKQFFAGLADFILAVALGLFWSAVFIVAFLLAYGVLAWFVHNI